MKAIAALTTAAVLLAGCSATEITSPPINITPNTPSKAVGVDVYAKDRARGNPVPRFRGQDIVQVRVRGKLDGGSSKELSGVPCTLDSGIYKAKFTSPANIVVPDYGPNSPALFVRCDGTQGSASTTVRAFNKTTADKQASAAAGGLLGAIIIGAVAAATQDNERDDFAYPMIRLSLKPKS